jgi:hypothetical protein
VELVEEDGVLGLRQLLSADGRRQRVGGQNEHDDLGGFDPRPDGRAPVGRAAADVLDVDPDVLAVRRERLRQPTLGELLVDAGVGEEDVGTIVGRALLLGRAPGAA